MSITTILQKGHNDASQMHYLVRKIRMFTNGFNPDKYWKRRHSVVDPKSKINVLTKLYFLFYCKKVEMRQNSSMGTMFNGGASFASDPALPHGMNGIVIGHNVRIGRKVIIYHQVTISDGRDGAPTIIGDNVLLGAGCKVLSGVHIGNNAKIGANCVVVEDIPDGATCVLQKPRIITKLTGEK